MPEKLISIAPMMDYTDRHERYFLRLISQYTWLYTEMLTSKSLLHGDAARLLNFSQREHPVALQLGGSDPDELRHCAKIGAEWGYDEINLNVGCPSDRVKSGQFGACLMAKPELVAECVGAMQQSVNIPVTIKCRLGIDYQDDYANLAEFVGKLSASGCKEFIIHARKAWLQGLSPKENREIPPLRYDFVYRLKKEYPQLHIGINGGIQTIDQAKEHLAKVDSVMIGRAAYSNPYLLATVDQTFYDKLQPIKPRQTILREYMDYVDNQLIQGTALTQMSRHLLGLFQGLPGAKAWRRHISENAHKSGMGTKLIRDAAVFVDLSL